MQTINHAAKVHGWDFDLKRHGLMFSPTTVLFTVNEDAANFFRQHVALPPNTLVLSQTEITEAAQAVATKSGATE